MNCLLPEMIRQIRKEMHPGRLKYQPVTRKKEEVITSLCGTYEAKRNLDNTVMEV